MFFSKKENHLASIIQDLDNDPAKVAALRTLAKSRSDSLYRWDAVVDGYVKMSELVLKNYKSKAALHDALAKEVYEPLKFFNKEN